MLQELNLQEMVDINAGGQDAYTIGHYAAKVFMFCCLLDLF